MKSLLTILFSTLILSADANIISVNFVDANATISNGRSIDTDTRTGAHGYASTNWINTLLGQNEVLEFEDGTQSSVNIFSRRPNGSVYIGNNAAVYTNTPLLAFAKALLASGQEPHVELLNLNENFPNGYSVVVYVSGGNANQGWSVTLNEEVDHTGYDKLSGITYFGKTLDDPDAYVSGLIPWMGSGGYTPWYRQVDYSVTGLTDASDSSLFPPATYAIFTNLSADSILLTVDGMKNNQAGLGGFQIVGNEGTRSVNISSLNGTVISNPAGTSHEIGTSLSLEAIPVNENYVFAGWSGDLRGDRHAATTNITVQGNMNISARFERA